MTAIKVIAVFIAIGTLYGCKKKDDTKLIISIDDVPWRLREGTVKATYYSNAKILYLSASDGTKWLDMGISLNATPLGNYLLEPNGSNVASLHIPDSPYHFMSDINVADAGGSFTITSFDTAQQKLSCNFKITSYGADRISKKIVSTSLTNLPFKTDTLKSNNEMSCIVNGVKITNWQTKTGTFLNCSPVGVDLFFYFIPGTRGLHFNIPFSLGTGTYSILPGGFNCGSGQLTAAYVLDSVYYPTSGSINITKMDVVQRKMEASFSMNVKDSRGDRIQITNGNIKINKWNDL